jgi:hypothetical protein
MVSNRTSDLNKYECVRWNAIVIFVNMVMNNQGFHGSDYEGGM